MGRLAFGVLGLAAALASGCGPGGRAGPPEPLRTFGADAVPIARNPMPSLNEGRIVRGKEARFARLKEGLVELPKQPKSASFFTVLGQDSKQAAE